MKHKRHPFPKTFDFTTTPVPTTKHIIYFSEASDSDNSTFIMESLYSVSDTSYLNFSTDVDNITIPAKEEIGQDDKPQLPIDMKFNEGHLLAILVYSVLMIFSAIGNISVLCTIARLRKHQGRLSPMNLLLFHLAIADLLVTFLMMPTEIAWNATVSWLAGDFLCRILSFTRIFGLFLSGFILMCISLDRYYAIVHPLAITQSGRRCRLMLTVAWFSSTVCSCPQPFIFHVETHPIFEWYQQCVTFNSFPNADFEIAYNFFGFTFLYGVPLVTIVSCYLRILLEIWRLNSRRRREEEQLRRSGMGVLGRAKARTLQMTVVIVSTFFFCWTPYNVMCLWYWLDSQSAQQVDQRIQKGLFLFACTNSCMNPLIYGMFHFRRRGHHTATIQRGDVPTIVGASGTSVTPSPSFMTRSGVIVVANATESSPASGNMTSLTIPSPFKFFRKDLNSDNK